MALPPSGTISINDVNTEFALGQNMAAYRGQLYGTTSGTAGVFSSGTINLSDFYSTQKVVAGGPTSLSSGSYTVPPYRTITFTAVGGSGGATGANGVYSGGPFNGTPIAGLAGGSGGASSVGTYVSAAGGGPGAAGSSASSGALTNPVLGGTGPTSGNSVTVTVGAGGTGGRGGEINVWNGSVYVFTGYAASGANGAAGSVTVSWTA